MIGLGYMYMHSEQEKEEEKGLPIAVAKDSKTKIIMARVAPSKRVDSYAVEIVKEGAERLGHKKIIMQRDNEPATLALKEAARRESDAAVGDHRANGLVENAIRRGRRVDGEREVAPWAVMHAASVVNRGRKDEGLRAHRRW